MPLVRISLKKGKPAAWRRAIADSVYDAMIETFNVPKDDRFILIHEHDGDDFTYSPDYLGIQRTDDLILIQLTVSNTRGVEQKQQLYRGIVERLVKAPGLRPEDVFINLVEVLPENWSFGNGVAQYVT
ncbi:Phenylpyruvate tautomerase PptA, 4-oxalocrotonate tautomerase family [Bradyrhizobium sp. NFR13]|uniref:tautomerase family protein n=1 Tax=Bradyrhizobium sp. NFR13 TaxID=1566285 RepID=UPI0008EFFB97|nr:tautomerase family protein [Bradyrhizobium sp. NFR13]SFM15473.1 Phenylpyruvate tautomerase PptA, 4-oxalocrotonate tautomerase family [Bradyrhizobium sp. NFR13]